MFALESEGITLNDRFLPLPNFAFESQVEDSAPCTLIFWKVWIFAIAWLKFLPLLLIGRRIYWPLVLVPTNQVAIFGWPALLFFTGWFLPRFHCSYNPQNSDNHCFHLYWEAESLSTLYLGLFVFAIKRKLSLSFSAKMPTSCWTPKLERFTRPEKCVHFLGFIKKFWFELLNGLFLACFRGISSLFWRKTSSSPFLGCLHARYFLHGVFTFPISGPGFPFIEETFLAIVEEYFFPLDMVLNKSFLCLPWK